MLDKLKDRWTSFKKKIGVWILPGEVKAEIKKFGEKPRRVVYASFTSWNSEYPGANDRTMLKFYCDSYIVECKKAFVYIDHVYNENFSHNSAVVKGVNFKDGDKGEYKFY